MQSTILWGNITWSAMGKQNLYTRLGATGTSSKFVPVLRIAPVSIGDFKVVYILSAFRSSNLHRVVFFAVVISLHKR